MNDTKRQELREALGEEWLVAGGTPPQSPEPSWGRMRLFDFKRTLYIGKERNQPHRWVLWDGRGDWFDGGEPFDVAEMVKDLQSFVLNLR